MPDPLSLDRGSIAVDNPALASGLSSSRAVCAPTEFALREREILRLLCQCFSNPEMAGRVYIGTRTVKFHVTNILYKLGGANRRDSAAIAARLGLV